MPPVWFRRGRQVLVPEVIRDGIVRRCPFSGARVPERDQTSSISTRSEMKPFSLVPCSSTNILESLQEQCQNQEEDVPLLRPVMETPGGQRDDSGPMTTVGQEDQLSGDAVPEREHTSSTSTRSEMKPFSLVPCSSTYTLESLEEQRQNQEEDVDPLLWPVMEMPGGQRDDSGPMTTIDQEDKLSGDAVPEREHTSSTSTRSGITINNEYQEMTNFFSKSTSTASRRTCCIFKVPHTFGGNSDSYHPHFVSIGPYHHGKPVLKNIEKLKVRYLNSLLCREPIKTLEDYWVSIKPLEKDAREYYSVIIQLESHEFIKMMVLDGCFIIELFRKIKDPRLFEPNDPLVPCLWTLPFVCRDFLLLENQIPFFILEKLFEISKMPSEEESSLSLSLLAMQFFNKYITLRRSEDFICQFRDPVWHLLDLVRVSFKPEEEITQSSGTPTPIMHNSSMLRRSGIKFKSVQEKNFLLVKFNNGVIEMPYLTLDKFMGSFLSNCVAFEQCHCEGSKYFTTYATFLSCLVKSANDAEYLHNHKIVNNNFGNDDEVVRFINNMGGNVMIDRDCYLSKLFENVDKYSRNGWNVKWAIFKHKYFGTPWAFISTLAKFVLFSLAIVQTLYTIMAYLHPNHEFP